MTAFFEVNARNRIFVMLYLIKLFSTSPCILQQFSTLTLEGMGYLSHDSPKSGARYDVVGEMRFNQKEPLRHTGTDYRYNVSKAEVLNNLETFACLTQMILCFKFK